jgi:putative SOS response-associated peptidase YedK
LGSRLVAAGAAWDLFDHLASRSKKFARNERLRHDRQYGVAGIRESWRNQNGAWERTFCIITVPTDELAGVVQDRMPAIIRSRSGLWARRTIFAEGEDFFSSLCYSI